ncbi:MAG: NTP transferase domain-containing protein, partial [Halobacteriaceae archaeon]
MLAGVLLAAGIGSRFEGGNKLLTSKEDEPIVVKAARPLVRSTNCTVAILGYESERIRATLAEQNFPIFFKKNLDYRSGQGSSVKAGTRWARELDANGAIYALGDMPYVSQSTYDELKEAFYRREANIVYPTYEGQRGNPVIFGQEHFEELCSL